MYLQQHDVRIAERLLKDALHISLCQVKDYFKSMLKSEGTETLQRLDLEHKQAWIDEVVWHCWQGVTSEYYSLFVVNVEKVEEDKMLHKLAH